MAKQSGLGDNFWVDGYDLSGDVGELSRIGGGPAVLDVTGISSSGYERIGGLRDGAVEFTSFFNDATGRAHELLSALPTSDVDAAYARGTTLGSPAAVLRAKQINYDPTRGTDGSLTIAVSAQANSFGIQWGEQLTAGIDTFASAGTGSGIDHGASTSFGLQAFLFVFDIDSGTATVTIQESSDDGSGDAYANVTGGAFAGVSAAGTQRIATAGGLTVEQWLRIDVSGTFTNLDCAVVVVRNLTAVVF